MDTLDRKILKDLSVPLHPDITHVVFTGSETSMGTGCVGITADHIIWKDGVAVDWAGITLSTGIGYWDLMREDRFSKEPLRNDVIVELVGDNYRLAGQPMFPEELMQYLRYEDINIIRDYHHGNEIPPTGWYLHDVCTLMIYTHWWPLCPKIPGLWTMTDDKVSQYTHRKEQEETL